MDEWPFIPPRGWRPPTLGDHARWVLWLVVMTAVVVDVLLCFEMKGALWVAALPLNVLALGIGLWAIFRGRRGDNAAPGSGLSVSCL